MPDRIPASPQAIFFDLDGTLLDSLPGIEFSIDQAFSICGLPKRNIDLKQLIGPPIRTILAHCAREATDAQLQQLETAFRQSYDSDGWQKTLHFPGSTQALRELHALGIPLFVVSNKPGHISREILRRESLLSLFTAVVTRDSITPPFPAKAAMIEHLLRRFQLDSECCIMVGDTAEDADAAAAMLVSFILMTQGYGDVPDSSHSPVAVRLNSFPELLPALTKEPAQ